MWHKINASIRHCKPKWLVFYSCHKTQVVRTYIFKKKHTHIGHIITATIPHLALFDFLYSVIYLTSSALNHGYTQACMCTVLTYICKYMCLLQFIVNVRRCKGTVINREYYNNCPYLCGRYTFLFSVTNQTETKQKNAIAWHILCANVWLADSETWGLGEEKIAKRNSRQYRTKCRETTKNRTHTHHLSK